MFAACWSVEVELLLEKALKIKFKIAVNMLDYSQAFWIIHKRCKIIKFKLNFIMNFQKCLSCFLFSYRRPTAEMSLIDWGALHGTILFRFICNRNLQNIFYNI